MAIPQIPQVRMPQQSYAAASAPLMAQFQASRAALQPRPVGITPGQGMTPGQVAQVLRGNALDVGKFTAAPRMQNINLDVGQDFRSRERFGEEMDKQDRIDSRSIYQAQQNFQNTKYADDLARSRSNDTREFNEKQRVELSQRLGPQLSQAYFDYEDWDKAGRKEYIEGLRDKFASSLVMDAALQQEFLQTDIGKQFGTMDRSGAVIALSEYIKEKIKTSPDLQARFHATYAEDVRNKERSLRQRADIAFERAAANGIQLTPPSRGGDNSLNVSGFGGSAGGSAPAPAPAPTADPLTGGVPADGSTFTPAQNLDLVQKFPGLDENVDGIITDAEIQKYIDNPLIDPKTLEGLRNRAVSLGLAAAAADQLFKTDVGQVGAKRAAENQAKKPAPITDTEVAEQSKKVPEAQKENLKKAQENLKKAQSDLAQLEKDVSTAKEKVKSLEVKKKKIESDLVDIRWEHIKKTLNTPGFKTDEKSESKQQAKNKEIAEIDAEIEDLNKKINSVDFESEKLNVEAHQEAVDKLKKTQANYGKNKGQDALRVKSSPDLKAAAQNNANARSLAKKFNISSEQLKGISSADGVIDQVKLRDLIAKQPIGSVSKLLGRIFKGRSIGAIFKNVLKGGAVVGLGLAPEIITAINSLRLSSAEREKLGQELKEYAEQLRQLNSVAQAQESTSEGNALVP